VKNDIKKLRDRLANEFCGNQAKNMALCGIKREILVTETYRAAFDAGYSFHTEALKAAVEALKIINGSVKINGYTVTYYNKYDDSENIEIPTYVEIADVALAEIEKLTGVKDE
jgi:hypothetical protein